MYDITSQPWSAGSVNWKMEHLQRTNRNMDYHVSPSLESICFVR